MLQMCIGGNAVTIYRYMQSMELDQFPGLEIMCSDFGNQVIVYMAVRSPKIRGNGSRSASSLSAAGWVYGT
jgi:hypothetical protein